VRGGGWRELVERGKRGEGGRRARRGRGKVEGVKRRLGRAGVEGGRGCKVVEGSRCSVVREKVDQTAGSQRNLA